VQDKCAGCLVPASNTSSFHSKISRVFLNRARWNRKYSTKFHIGLPATYQNSLSAEFSRKTGFRCQLREAVPIAVCSVLSYIAASQFYPARLA